MTPKEKSKILLGEKSKILLGESCLEYAITRNYHALETILEAYNGGEGVTEHKDSGGMTALAWSVRRGDYPITLLLLRHGADPNAKDNDQRSPLHESIAHGSIAHGDSKILKILLQHGADPTAKDKFGRTPLHLAASTATHNLEIHKVLLDHGASPLEKDRDNPTGSPLSIAKHLNYQGIISLYKENIKDKIKNKIGKRLNGVMNAEVEL